MVKYSISALPSVMATSHVWLLSTCNVARALQELTLKFYLILVNITLNSYMWLMTTVLGSMDLDSGGILHHDASSSCKLPLSIAWAHLAILCHSCREQLFLGTFFSYA